MRELQETVGCRELRNSGPGRRRLLGALAVLGLVLGACGDDDDTSADADGVDFVDSGLVDADAPSDVGVIDDPCVPFLELESIAVADEGSANDDADAEGERQRILADLRASLEDDAPSEILDAIDILVRLHPIGGDPSADDQEQIEVANTLVHDHLGPGCGLGDGLGNEVGPVTLGGVGQVSIGMPIDEAAAIIGFDTSDPGFQEQASACAYMIPTPGLGYDGLEFMVFDGVVQRIDVFEGGWFTPSGIGLGASVADLDAAYGDALETGPSKYDENGTYVEFVPSDPGNDGLRLLFETSNGVVKTFRAGFTDPVRYVEGCS